eukprot:CAMPEP_0116881022 /NCGR_PEP_ID=MMETSP0463-20121206/13077_1 /TAXON_ID=181622 /ORGANISM="Strombidinopsis sp, Strain SopsisLIS2011" /LENGTH=63 /DNA_ID=CAMNT_0004532437 /DNA_START=160 /DNA_END=351 /DNA_ORIENTATION=-
MPSVWDDLFDITFTVNGNVYASEDYMSWPNQTDSNGSKNSARYIWEIDNSSFLKFQGNGTVDG